MTVAIAIRDTGAGVSPKDLAYAFERFYRADPVRARGPGGTGLGLPIARWIARQRVGDVTLASELGQGSSATVWPPVPQRPYRHESLVAYRVRWRKM